MIASSLLRTKKSVIEAFKILDEFPFFSGLKPNKEKCQIAAIGVKKGVKVTLCAMKKTDLKKKHSENSYNKKLENEKNFKNQIKKVETVLKI